jgi:hypothetical protein
MAERMKPVGWCDTDDLKAGLFNAASKRFRGDDTALYTADQIREAVERVEGSVVRYEEPTVAQTCAALLHELGIQEAPWLTP